MPHRRTFARILFLALFAASPALACTAPGGSDAQIRSGAVDQQQLSAAILDEVNLVRCRAGRSALKQAPQSLIEVARGHSLWMASTHTMSHTGGRATGRTLTDRVRRAGLRPRAFAENLAFLPRFRGGGTGRASGPGTCSGSHTYRSLAQSVVQMWMNSAGHRRNLLSSQQHRMSAAASITPEGRCGRLWITQIFTG